MTSTSPLIVTTQAELDAALADDAVTRIEIRSERGVWLTIGDTGTTEVTVAGESTIERCSGRVGEVTGSGRVGEVGGSGRVDRVTDSGRVDEVTDSGSVGEVTGSGRVDRVGGSGRVDWVTGSGRVGRVTDSGRVDRVGGSGRVDWVGGSGRVDWVGDSGSVGRVTGSGSVGEVTGSGRVDWVGDSGSVGRVTGSGSVGEVTGSGSVERASGTATVHLHGRSTLTRAGRYVAVFLHSAHATAHGGQMIDLTTVDLGERQAWIGHHAVDTLTPSDGPLAGVEVAVLYKAVRDDLRSHHGFAYPIGELVSCEDWEDTDACGAGLHLSPSPREARDYDSHATRYLACHVPVADLRPITDGGPAKCKTPRVLAMEEVDIDGRPLPEAAAAVA